MRREGYEFSVSKPEVILRESERGLLEPVERVFIEVMADYLGPVTELIGKRRGLLQDMRYGEDGTVYIEYLVPTRGILGFRQPFLTVTRGTGTFNTLFHAYEPLAGAIDVQEHSSLIALEPGTVSAYALLHLQQRGTFFVRPSEEVYTGMVVGQTISERDMILNVCRTKHLTGHRAAPKGIAEALATPRLLSLDDAIEYLGPDELLEVTPTALRIRKRELRHDARAKAGRDSRTE
jgi:GTP-binding protein